MSFCMCISGRICVLCVPVWHLCMVHVYVSELKTLTPFLVLVIVCDVCVCVYVCACVRVCMCV